MNVVKIAQGAFNSVKYLITNVPVFIYYKPKEELILENGACEYDLEAARIQKKRPVTYASC